MIMQKIGIVCAMQSEANLLTANLTLIGEYAHQKYYSGEMKGKQVILCICKIGKVNAAVATATLILEYKVEKVFNIGIVGGIKGRVQIGDILLIEKAVYSDFDTSPIGDEVGFVSGSDCIYFPLDTNIQLNNEHKRAIIASADSFTHCNQRVQKLNQRFDCVAFDMEICAIAQTCKIFGVSCTAIKVVCDYADEESHNDYKLNIEQCCELVQNTFLQAQID